MTDTPVSCQQVAYLGKVIAGLLALIGLALASVLLESAELGEPLKNALVAVLVLSALALPVFVRAVYRKMDELQKRLHERACVFSLGLTFSASFVAGILQSHHIVPEFSPFWICATIVCSWGLGLALANRQFS